MKKRNKALTLILLLVVMIGVTVGGIYSYWAGTIANPSHAVQAQEVTIGQGKDVNTELDVSQALASSGKKLVPAGKAALSAGGESANVESFDATYTVYWKEAAGDDVISADDNIEGNLAVTATPKINGAETYNNLVNVSISPENTQITADGAAVTITVKVTLSEPADKAAYDAIINQGISVSLNFAVTQ